MATIDAGLMVRLLAPGDAEGASNAVKGQALEKAIRYAFEQIPGVTCYMQDERNAFETEEVDLLFANVAHEDGLARFFGSRRRGVGDRLTKLSTRVGAGFECW